jgi:hypothetical protein
MRPTLAALLATLPLASTALGQDDVTRVFVFAGQSNMVGSDSHVEDIRRFPPFAGLEEPQPDVRFSYVLGREDKTRSAGWVDLQPVRGVVGPELSFAREVARRVDAPLAIVKCAAGGTHLGGDWNPDEPSGFAMYPLLMEQLRASLAELERKGVAYRLEGFVWHQGENDMFNEAYMQSYGANLQNFVSSVRRDLRCPELRFYVGELCTKTIWGMDLRPRMHAISLGQRKVAAADPLVDYVRTSHVGVEIGAPVGLHYHYGTLGQLEHGVNYARAYLANIGVVDEPAPQLAAWPHAEGSTVRLFVLAGHRNMEGERAFVQELAALPGGDALRARDPRIPYRYDTGGGFLTSTAWEPLGPAGAYDTFGPELSFGAALRTALDQPLAIAKFTHSGSQIIDWTPEGSEAATRNLYPEFLDFVRAALAELEGRGHAVELAGIFYHVGENDMSFAPYRREAPARLRSIIRQSRADLALPTLRWFVSQQPPTRAEGLDALDVTAGLARLAAEDAHCVHVPVFDLPPQAEELVLDTAAIVQLGERLARAYLASERSAADLLDFTRRPADAVQLVGAAGHVLVPESDAPCQWVFADGVLTASPGWDSVVTPESYQDFRLHLEFNVNDAPNAEREARGNSGVYLQQRYELQILDSFGVPESEYRDSDCGSLYRLKKPDRLVCKPAGEWQSYDIVFRAARFDGDRKREDARIIAFQNGALIHADVSITRKTGAGEQEGPEARPVKLQGHHNPVRFRDVWIQALTLEELPSVPAARGR